ncbi:hypothetical protein EMCRGX_G030252, partial [Ephydatia muelleri]
EHTERLSSKEEDLPLNIVRLSPSLSGNALPSSLPDLHNICTVSLFNHFTHRNLILSVTPSRTSCTTEGPPNKLFDTSQTLPPNVKVLLPRPLRRLIRDRGIMISAIQMTIGTQRKSTPEHTHKTMRLYMFVEYVGKCLECSHSRDTSRSTTPTSVAVIVSLHNIHLQMYRCTYKDSLGMLYTPSPTPNTLGH